MYKLNDIINGTECIVLDKKEDFFIVLYNNEFFPIGEKDYNIFIEREIIEYKKAKEYNNFINKEEAIDELVSKITIHYIDYKKLQKEKECKR